MKRDGIKRRRSKLTWILGTSAVIFGLVYWEQPLLLYVLSTLAMCALFIVVAFANLKAGNDELQGKDHP